MKTRNNSLVKSGNISPLFLIVLLLINAILRALPDNMQLSNTEQDLFAHLGMLSPILRARGKTSQSLELEFIDGTPCDLKNVNRSTVVAVFCGPRLVNCCHCVGSQR
jgi:hypothetical protein